MTWDFVPELNLHLLQPSLTHKRLTVTSRLTWKVAKDGLMSLVALVTLLLHQLGHHRERSLGRFHSGVALRVETFLGTA